MPASRDIGSLGDAISGTANVNFDAGTLFIDGVNNRVGIGTANTLGNSLLNVAQGVVARSDTAGIVPYLQLYNLNAGTNLKTWRMGAQVNGGFNIESVNDAYSSASEFMRVDSSGRVTKPNTPAFTAYGGSGLTTTGSTQTALFTTVPVNVGSCYNSGNGRFTAPVAGRYFFSYSISQSGTASGPVMLLLKNNSSVAQGAIAYSTAYNSAAAAAVVDLAVNDFASVGIIGFNSSFSSIDYGYSGFSGFLIG
jgi:hypothetical protein